MLCSTQLQSEIPPHQSSGGRDVVPNCSAIGFKKGDAAATAGIDIIDANTHKQQDKNTTKVVLHTRGGRPGARKKYYLTPYFSLVLACLTHNNTFRMFDPADITHTNTPATGVAACSEQDITEHYQTIKWPEESSSL